MISIQRVGRTGTSLYAIIPRPIANALRISRGDCIAVAAEKGRVVICKVNERELIRPPRPAPAISTPKPPTE